MEKFKYINKWVYYCTVAFLCGVMVGNEIEEARRL